MTETIPDAATLSLGEELLLLAMDDERGTVHGAAAAALPFGLAGALLLDLTLRGRLAAEGNDLTVADRTPTGDDLLDEALATIAGARRARSARHWIARLSGGASHLKDRLLGRLIWRGILRREDRPILGIIPSPRYPAVDFTTEWELRQRIRATVLEGEAPDARTAVLLSLVQACRLADAIFTREERAPARRRLHEIARGECVGTAVAEAVAGMEAAAAAAVIAATSASVACATTAASC